ncbi:NADH dehydrogenase [ubiquinone] 1 alpha subcomplex subunit 7-like [Mizuhopecten yessoensis]|uniref:NADH dehydrogenase [ubiquinone] 1 alpha subcomplex subunit 7 n=1 Tax=Mizuhopecten yessoensis TaxID=6573 RepID=A0A210PNU0_MIZYE|nr:NADH dehydrogenase [ubiquinone] 1 alpha subcomplex subunit 7-like [Mizuhopecten yessoensis]OWF38151.1 NADH dehydrogenase [ubiquinone] 1 alpha subcomplex subunit 7 [Mizuhopecten yessoensis]
MSALKKMAYGTDNRAQTKLIVWIRNKLTKNIIYKDANRFPDSQSARDQPPPNLPDGPSAKLSDNYFYTRDARCLMGPPKVLFAASQDQKTLTAGGTVEKASSDVVPKKTMGPTPPGFRLHPEMTPKPYNPKWV